MLVGILSDSHGRAAMVRRVLEIFDRLGVEHVTHCGDIGGSSVFEEFIGRSCTLVWGNADDPEPSLLDYLKSIGVSPPRAGPIHVDGGGKTFAIYHGHESGFGRACASAETDYLLHGHTHIARDERRGNMRIINPGALHRATPKSAATLNTETDELVFHRIAEK